MTSHMTRTATVRPWLGRASAAAVAGRHRRVALRCASGPGVRRHGSDLEEAPVPHRDRASRAEGWPGGGAHPYANAESGRRAAQPADAGHPRPAARQVARGPRRRPIDQAGLREQHPQAHPTVARVVVPDPAGCADPGLLLRRAAPLSRALQRAATSTAPHDPGAQLRRARRNALLAGRPGKLPSLPPRLQAARLPRTGQLHGQTDPLDHQRRPRPRGRLAVDRGQPSRARQQAATPPP